MNNKRFAVIILSLFAALLAFAVMSAFSSCTPERRLKRILKKHPELVKTDTIWRTDFDTIPEIRINTVFQTDTSTLGLDSIFGAFQGQIDSVLALRLKSEVRNYIINRPFLPDTMYTVQDGVTVKIYQNGDQIGVIVSKPETIVTEQAPVVVNKVDAAATEYPWYYKILFILALGFAFYVGFRMARTHAR